MNVSNNEHIHVGQTIKCEDVQCPTFICKYCYKNHPYNDYKICISCFNLYISDEETHHYRETLKPLHHLNGVVSVTLLQPLGINNRRY